MTGSADNSTKNRKFLCLKATEVDLASAEVISAQFPTWYWKLGMCRAFEEEDLMRLCKGLHYVMWMQDKMLLQEELADRIGGLINIFGSEEEKIRFFEAFFKSLSKEWPHIDRWRMDKFLMEVRRMVRATFAHLASLKWKKETRDEYWKVLGATVVSAVMSSPPRRRPYDYGTKATHNRLPSATAENFRLAERYSTIQAIVSNSDVTSALVVTTNRKVFAEKGTSLRVRQELSKNQFADMFNKRMWNNQEFCRVEGTRYFQYQNQYAIIQQTTSMAYFVIAPTADAVTSVQQRIEELMAH